MATLDAARRLAALRPTSGSVPVGAGWKRPSSWRDCPWLTQARMQCVGHVCRRPRRAKRRGRRNGLARADSLQDLGGRLLDQAERLRQGRLVASVKRYVVGRRGVGV